MNELDRWQWLNDRYLAEALAWLRLRLERFIEVSGADSAGWEGERAAARAPSGDAAGDDPPPALVLLSRRFGLSRFERDVLLLCSAMELDTRIASLCARAQDDADRPYPTFALALSLFDEPAWDVLTPIRPLRHWRLIEVGQPGLQPLSVSPLHADERIVHFLKGVNRLDDRLAPLLTALDMAEGPGDLPRSQGEAVSAILRHLEGRAGTRPAPVIQLSGPEAAGKRLVAAQAAEASGLHLYRLPAELLPTTAADLELLVRLWRRETLLLPVALYLDAEGVEAGRPAEALAPPVGRFLERGPGVVFVGTLDPLPGLDRSAVVIEAARATPGEQHEAWAAALGPEAGESPALLAGQFNLDFPTIRRIARAALVEGPTDPRPLPERLWQACLAQARPRLEGLAERLEVKASWDDLVLPAAEADTLRRIADQVRRRSTVYDAWGFRAKMSRGLGISALFAGESGTGKTLAAEVLCHELRLDLYRIDLSAVVSKYIGETEKNLRRLFDAAEDGGGILFFDEADALFGRRGEVRESHDRYANIEVNYLLQRMESYRGLAILATNRKAALDPAFLRRIRFVVHFGFPGPAERRAIWQAAFPASTPTTGLDLDRLVRLNLTGGSIRNVALDAAFRAAGAGSAVTMPLILAAAHAEYRKLERPISEADFRRQPPDEPASSPA